jgi:hypothetical protein
MPASLCSSCPIIHALVRRFLTKLGDGTLTGKLLIVDEDRIRTRE